MQVLTIVAYRQPVREAGIESVRGTGSDSAIGRLLQRQLIALDEHRLFTTTRAFSEVSGLLRDLADLPQYAILSSNDQQLRPRGDALAPNDARLAGQLGVDSGDLAAYPHGP
jgi:chromosome segregation and condensation protein ScpB